MDETSAPELAWQEPMNEESLNTIRVVEIDSQPWFLAADVCRALGLESAPATPKRPIPDTQWLANVSEAGATHWEEVARLLDFSGARQNG